MKEELSTNQAALGDDLTERLAGLSPAKRALLELRLKKQSPDTRGQQTIPRLADRSAIPLSFSQQRLWFFDQLEPGSTVFNNTSAFFLRGPLNVGALEKSLNELLRRHEVLRTRFVLLNGEPVQVVSEDARLALSVLDLQNVPESEREAEARRLGYEESRRPFDLAKGPLFRASLMRLGSDHHLMMTTIHHIVSDGWSMRIFMQEFSTLYADFSNGRVPSLPELPIQYADFARWQRDWLQGEVLEKQLSYWKKQLEGISTLSFPTDRPRPPVQTFHGEKESIVLPKPLHEALAQLSRLEGTTLFMTLLASFAVLLHRHTGQDDIVLGCPIAGRNRAEIEGLIGFFINTLVLRADLSGNPSFRELLARVRKMALDAYAHQDLPFEKLVEELRPERDSSRTPLFQVFLNMLGLEARGLQLEGLTVERLTLSEPESKFDFTVYIRGANQEIRLELVYNADLFHRDRMVEMLRQFEALLRQIVRNPNKAIGSFSLVTPAAKAVLPDPTQALHTDWPAAIHTRFSQQAQRTPDRAAVVSNHGTWTYKDVESRSDGVADFLHRNGIRPGDIVAVYAARSASLVPALIGIHKAGAAFLILDAAYPPARLVDYLRIARPKGWIVLEEAGTSPDVLEDFVSTLPDVCRLTFSHSGRADGQGASTGHPARPPALPIGPDDLAYVAFTSGTTGTRKAIEGTHAPLSHFLKWHSETFGLKETDRFTMLSGLSHDPLLRDIFTPLWLGATLCIPDMENMSAEELATWIHQHAISVIHATPAMAELLVEGLGTAGYESTPLRYVFFGGDTLSESQVAKIKRFAPGATCVNFYGATETPQAMGYFVVPEQIGNCNGASDTSKRLVPLGRGIEGVHLLVLNRTTQLAGIGELGEIHVRTPYLARGYKDDETLTRDRFLVNPFTEASGDRVYRTGDLGRYLPDGTVEFAGRHDRQVKIRGFRIELGEIEAALMEHPAVQSPVVVPHGHTDGDKCLVAYMVCNGEERPTPRELRKFLRRTLPEYMIPVAFISLDALPLTPNGKVDRKALPEPDELAVDGAEEQVEPRTAMERVIAKVWQEVLGVNRISVHDNFFDLGGHSLLSVKVIARIEEEIGQRIHPREMVYQTLAQLAAACEQREAAGAEHSARPAGRAWLSAIKGILNRS